MRAATVQVSMLALVALAYWQSAAPADEVVQPKLLTDLGISPVTEVPPSPAPVRGMYAARPNSRYANPIHAPDLRRLGPCPGSCEVGWYAGRLWFRTELLAWGAKETHLPALATTGDPATPPADAGALDQPDTVVLFGDFDEHDEIRLGGRLTVGWWFTREQWDGFEVVYFGLGGQDVHFRANSDLHPILARPYTDVTTGQEESHLIAYPGLLLGETSMRVDSEVAGAEVLMRHALAWTPQARLDLIYGYRHAHLFDRVMLNDFSVSIDAASGFPVDTLIERRDYFQTENNFHGGQVGLSGRLWQGCWSLQWVNKVAYGNTYTKNGIEGETDVTDFTGVDPVTTTYSGGVLALPTNIGRHDVDDPAWMHEFGISLECQLTSNSRMSLGYTILYWDMVTRAPSMLPTGINPTQIPPGVLVGDALPVFQPLRTSFWAQGLNASFEYQF